MLRRYNVDKPSQTKHWSSNNDQRLISSANPRSLGRSEWLSPYPTGQSKEAGRMENGTEDLRADLVYALYEPLYSTILGRKQDALSLIWDRLTCSYLIKGTGSQPDRRRPIWWVRFSNIIFRLCNERMLRNQLSHPPCSAQILLSFHLPFSKELVTNHTVGNNKIFITRLMLTGQVTGEQRIDNRLVMWLNTIRFVFEGRTVGICASSVAWK